MLKKRVTLFGRSFSLAAVVLALTAVAALASFAGILLLNASVSGTAAGVSGASFSWESPVSCAILSGIGSASCSVSATNVSLSVSGVDNDSILRFTAVGRNNGSATGCLAALPTGWTYGTVAGTMVLVGIPSTGSDNFRTDLGFGSLVANESISATLDYTFTSTGCS